MDGSQLLHEAMATDEAWAWRNFGGGMLLCTQRGGAKVVITASGGKRPYLMTRGGDGLLRPVLPSDPRMRVMAAAPRLLQAAKAAMYELEQELHQRQTSGLGEDSETLARIVDALQAAVEVAETGA
jgi:hypothetical protein